MSYGLYVEGGNGILQLDSSKNYLEGYAVKDIGTKSTKFTEVEDTDIFFFNYVPPAGTQRGILRYDSRYTASPGPGFPNTLPTGNDFHVIVYNPSTDTYNSQTPVNFVQLRKTALITPTGTYGLQLFKENGSVKVFDSRMVQNGFTVTQYFAEQTVGGNSSSNPYGEAISTNPNAYVSLLHTIYGGAFVTSFVYFSNNHSTYDSNVYSGTFGYWFSTNLSYEKNLTPIILGETF